MLYLYCNVFQLNFIEIGIYQSYSASFVDEVWRHWLHADLEMSLKDTTLTVLHQTRDDCLNQCVNSSCHAFSVCGDQTYATCHIYTTNITEVNDTSISYDPDCDLFTPVQPKFICKLLK